ncbi:MAG TPA: multifunctional oxoglutarate decarboxylase/oxoglutarate dehydrogenase thiamine pyrophosphate-binding subunit/dihydrolipoyllysine-residue succinyltransferase subunit [Bryobacteraceae bacterium]|nr:multifunctional oxoglutarate decarboxylase/oxoglutarate dehydrogenase thiamine pyrophosphate-binding subunit/dihydrolipoyllysine-residue succinyltransferase subunit [Bryobacteraceae bacterium]
MQHPPKFPSKLSSDEPRVNRGLEEELFYEYRHDRKSVDAGWGPVFEGNGHTGNGGVAVEAADAPPSVGTTADVARTSARSTATATATATTETPELSIQIGQNDQLVPLRGPALKIAENMEASLSIPVATSQRVMPVKVIDENRRLVNQYRELAGKPKISYTHLVAWAIVRALEKVPVLNQAYAERGAESFRVTRGQVNLGLAIDVAGKDGARSLKVPSVKNAQAMNFAQFLAAYDDLVVRARANTLTLADFEGATISLTNPGTVGTAGSIPRLMPGQGAIIATGAIDYPPEYRGVPEETRAAMGLSKVMAVTCTYDHRVIQGAESGAFLARLQALLEGEDEFYTAIFSDLSIPVRPFKWEPDQAASQVVNADPLKQAGVARLIDAWRERGHLLATIDPLGNPRHSHPDLEPATHGLTIWDLDRSFHAGPFGVMTLRALIERLHSIYAGPMGVQYLHIHNPQERMWLEERLEASPEPLPEATRKRALRDIVLAQGFEEFLENRFKGHKRFSIEGGETTIAIVEELLERAAGMGAEEVVIGMAHRGRLTLLANVVGKGVAQMFSEFEGDLDPESNDGQGDVKYHLGAANVRHVAGNAAGGRTITVSVAANPSHLEAVNPVVEGIVRPKQDRLGDSRRERVIPLLIHGDAAMAGQGIVAETFNFSQIDGYNTGGTVHLVINNQIGFTTSPEAARSTTYCTDIALAFGAPVFHVNGDDPEACLRATRLAHDYRRTFHKDAVIDMVCYRKHGHNEGDDPSYTQPLVYRQLERHTPASVSYAARLVGERVVTEAEIAEWLAAQKKQLYEIYDQTQRVKEQYELHELSPIPAEGMPMDLPPTAVDRGVLHRILDGVTTFPPEFHLHPKLQRVVDRRKEAHAGPHVDWALAETLAFGSLVLEGTPVRLSGQDCGRGTFSQRHAEFHDFENGRVYTPLQHLAPGQAPFEVYNSPLSEYGVLGFEFGYSIADPLSLVLWEAQYGDFANGAQIVIDQFISAAESKWGQPSGLVMLLPHGQEGGGPEHSSARLERFLQLCAENNMQVAYATTPAQYFHLLRRQMRGGADRRGLRKPLIVMTPKSLLRHPKVVSTVDELASGVFVPVLDDPAVGDPSGVRRILLCTGKIYYELASARDSRGAKDCAIVRLEQLYPYPQAEVAAMLERYPSATEVIWVQEEPRNMGAWAFLRGHLKPMLSPRHVLGYAGRPRSASPAPGLLKQHQREQTDLLAQAFGPPSVARSQRKRLVKRRKS